MTATEPRPRALDDWDGDAGAAERPLSPVTVLLDPADDAAVTARLLAEHNPGAGRVIVHPTPSVTSTTVLAHDLLAAFGHPIGRLAEEKISGAVPAWQAITAWTAAGEVEHLVVLRAHKLSRGSWERLLQLWRHTGVRFALVCHQRDPGHDAADLLRDLPHRITRRLADVLGRPLPPPMPRERAGSDAADEDLPPLPDDDVAGFRAEAWRRLSPAEFARVDAAYALGLDAACRWLAARDEQSKDRLPGPGDYLAHLFPSGLRPRDIAAGTAVLEARYPRDTLRTLAGGLLCLGPDPLRDATKRPARWDDDREPQRFLGELVADSPSRRHSIARLRGAQAGALLHGVLLTLPGNLAAGGGPGLTGVPLDDDLAARIRAGVASPVHAAALAIALFTGFAPSDLAELPISALAPDCSALAQQVNPGTPSGATLVVLVPAAARRFLAAARTFLALRATPPGKRLLALGIGNDGRHLEASAQACGLALPTETVRPSQSWQLRVAAWHLGTRLHTTAGIPR